jgi:hypothetical protein
MAADDRFEPRRHRRRDGRNDEAGPQAWPQPARGRVGHRRRGFSSSDEPKVVRTFRSALCGRPKGLHYICSGGIQICQRVVHQPVRRSRSNTGPDNRQDVVSKIRE